MKIENTSEYNKTADWQVSRFQLQAELTIIQNRISRWFNIYIFLNIKRYTEIFIIRKRKRRPLRDGFIT